MTTKKTAQAVAKKPATEKRTTVQVATAPRGDRVRRYAGHFTIKVLKKDMKPKRNGRNPYAIYKDGATIAELLKAGVKAADLWYDSLHSGAIEIVRG